MSFFSSWYLYHSAERSYCRTRKEGMEEQEVKVGRGGREPEGRSKTHVVDELPSGLLDVIQVDGVTLKREGAECGRQQGVQRGDGRDADEMTSESGAND